MTSLSALQPLFDASATRAYSKGSVILYQSEVPRYLHVVKSGVVRAYSITPTGEERIATFHIDGEPFPSSWAYRKTPATIFYYDAFSDCEVYLVKRADFNAYLEQHPYCYPEVLDYYVTSYIGSLLHVSSLEHLKASDKILHTLHYLTVRYGKDLGGKMTQIKLHLTHKDFANLVGLTRETTAIEMNKLKQQGIISYHSQRYIVRMDALAEVLGEDKFKQVTL